MNSFLDQIILLSFLIGNYLDKDISDVKHSLSTELWKMYFVMAST